jgi:hypothetical protein
LFTQKTIIWRGQLSCAARRETRQFVLNIEQASELNLIATSSDARGDHIAKELRRLGWKEGGLSERAKSDPGKVGLAAKLRQETTLTMGQIAQRLHMGNRNTLSTNLQERKGTNE